MRYVKNYLADLKISVALERPIIEKGYKLYTFSLSFNREVM